MVEDACTRYTAAGQRQTAAPGGARRSSLNLKLWCTILSADRLNAKRWSSRTCPGGLGGGSDDHDGAHCKGAAQPMAACGGKGYGP
jgi:hypothetical protein